MAKIQHYLITVKLNSNFDLHCYLMTNDKKIIQAATNKLCDEAEKIGIGFLPVVLQTTLANADGGPDGVDIVREILGKNSEEARETLKTAHDFHMTIFGMPSDHPDNMKLMDLH